MEKKSLPLHLDGSDQNCGKAIACCVPLIGRFRLRTYMDLEMRTPVDECIYGPGELVLINNRKYYHDGLVLDDTRLAIHCFLDFENFRA